MHRLSGVLSLEELTLLRQILADAPFEDAKLSVESYAVVKNNRQLSRADSEVEALDRTIAAALSRHELFSSAAFPVRYVPPLYLRYEPGMLYDAHVDTATFTYGTDTLRADISVTVFLNNPDEYEGGELVLDLPGGPLAVKLPAGDAIAYSTHTVHQVRPVTSGERLVAVTWAQSRVRDPQMRQVLFDLHAVSASLAENAPASVERRLLLKAERNLLRLVAE